MRNNGPLEKKARGRREGNMRLTAAGLLSLIGVTAATGTFAAGKLPQFWNLTSSTVAGLEISKVGANAFGPNQTVNDPDGAVEHDERLKITGIEAGLYDVRLTLRDGRICFARNVKIQDGKPFSIEDKNLINCAKK
jgi:hypothetical protein